MARYPEDEFPTRPNRRISTDEMLGRLMADQAALRREFETVRKNSLRAPPVLAKRDLAGIVTAVTVIVTAIVSVLRELGVIK